MKFTKMHGCGNDYVYVNCFEEKVDEPEKVAIFVSDRHFGIGSDGLILIKPSENADFEMAMYNADGSRSEMCGNGIRCVAKYVYDNKLTDKTTFSIESMGKIKYIKLYIEDKIATAARVDMGKPVLESGLIPVISENDRVVKEEIMVCGEEYEMTCVNMGNPHSVVFVNEELSSFPIEKVGPEFESHKRFPQRVNTEFAYVIDRKNIEMRVWERGTGETLACGTGSCATAVAAIINGLCDNDVCIHLLGGELLIHWSGNEDESVFMTGPATTVFLGEINI